MEKMNQVSVSEFFAKTKEELYDMAAKMVEKYNRLVDICNDSSERIADLVKENERKITYADALNKDIAEKAVKIKLMEQEIEGRKEGYYALKDKMTDLEETLEIRTKENKSLIKANEKLEKERDKHIIDRNATIMQLEKQVKYLEKELNDTCACKELDLKGHNRREMALVNELADKNDEIKKLEESIEYYKNQERIRTDQLRATERKVEELHGSINRLTLNCRAKNTEIARLTKEHSDIRHELAKRTAELEFNGEDDHGRAGFKKYIEWLIEEEERAVPERFKERLNKEITEIFTKEEETEVEVDKSKNYGPIPESVRSARRAAKVNDIPCGEDAIE